MLLSMATIVTSIWSTLMASARSMLILARIKSGPICMVKTSFIKGSLLIQMGMYFPDHNRVFTKVPSGDAGNYPHISVKCRPCFKTYMLDMALPYSLWCPVKLADALHETWQCPRYTGFQGVVAFFHTWERRFGPDTPRVYSNEKFLTKRRIFITYHRRWRSVQQLNQPFATRESVQPCTYFVQSHYPHYLNRRPKLLRTQHLLARRLSNCPASL